MRRVQLKIEGDICGGIQKPIPISEILLKESRSFASLAEKSFLPID